MRDSTGLAMELLMVVVKIVFLLPMQAWGRAPSCCRWLPCWAQTHRRGL